MPIITFSSPKGGCGKTTSATILATELALKGVGVTIVDADPNRDVTYWSKLRGVPEHLDVISDVTEDNIIDVIEVASARSAIVVVDLEGMANLLVARAISFSDLVVIPIQGSDLDAKHAAQEIRQIRLQERTSRRLIPFTILLTKTSPALIGRTQKNLEARFAAQGVPIFATRLVEREAFKALFSYGGTLEGLDPKAVSNLPAAIANARAYVGEVVDTIRKTTVQAA
jgi:chromosome partitioning protein